MTFPQLLAIYSILIMGTLTTQSIIAVSCANAIQRVDTKEHRVGQR